MRIRCIGDELLVSALRLAGITGRAVENEQEAAEALGEYAGEESIILVGRSAYRWVRESVERLLTEHRHLCIVEIPDLEVGKLEVESERKLVERVLGVRL